MNGARARTYKEAEASPRKLLSKGFHFFTNLRFLDHHHHHPRLVERAKKGEDRS